MAAWHFITYTDADGLQWFGIAERVGRTAGKAIYQITIPGDALSSQTEDVVLPKLAWGMHGARAAVAEYYEDNTAPLSETDRQFAAMRSQAEREQRWLP